MFLSAKCTQSQASPSTTLGFLPCLSARLPQLSYHQLCLFLWSIVFVNISMYISHFPSLACWEHLDKEKGSWDSASVAGNRLPARILWKGWRKRNRYLQLNILNWTMLSKWGSLSLPWWFLGPRGPYVLPQASPTVRLPANPRQKI